MKPSLVPLVQTVGREGTPVITLDEHPFPCASVRAVAREFSGFAPDRETFYPGVRATLPADYTRALIEQIEPLIRAQYEVPAHYRCRCTRQLYSLATTPESELGVLQRVPHVDTRWPYYFALMHYLNPGEFGGTGFFRHRPTGFERLTDERFARFKDLANEHMHRHGQPSARYCRSSDSHFELTGQVAYRENRLVLYPGNLLHTALIEPGRDLGADPGTGRLTANVFLDFVPR